MLLCLLFLIKSILIFLFPVSSRKWDSRVGYKSFDISQWTVDGIFIYIRFVIILWYIFPTLNNFRNENSASWFINWGKGTLDFQCIFQWRFLKHVCRACNYSKLWIIYFHYYYKRSPRQIKKFQTTFCFLADTLINIEH